MNLILFETMEVAGGRSLLPLSDPRALHILGVLRLDPGETFEAGIIDGARGTGTLEALDEESLRLSFVWGEAPPPLPQITLVVGLPRPQTARKLLREVTALGVAAMHFVRTDLGEPNYAQSPLWTTDEWRRLVIDGTQQAFDTHLPEVTAGRRLKGVLTSLPAAGSWLALDNYVGAQALGATSVQTPAVLALGPERGWSDREREVLREAGFEMVHLGERVLRVETACVAAVALVRSRLGMM